MREIADIEDDSPTSPDTVETLFWFIGPVSKSGTRWFYLMVDDIPIQIGLFILPEPNADETKIALRVEKMLEP
jgi:hypothetical protein